MLEQLLIQHVWLAIALCGGSYISDYYLTLYSARLYQAKAKEHFSFGGSFELTPYYQTDVDRLRRWSPHFGLMLFLLVIAVLLVWWLTVRWLNLPDLFLFLVGALLLREAAIHVRHIRNIVLFRYARDTEEVKGHIEYSRRLVLKISADEMASFSLLFLLIALLVDSWLILGGAVACAIIGFEQLKLARKAGATQ